MTKVNLFDTQSNPSIASKLMQYGMISLSEDILRATDKQAQTAHFELRDGRLVLGITAGKRGGTVTANPAAAEAHAAFSKLMKDIGAAYAEGDIEKANALGAGVKAAKELSASFTRTEAKAGTLNGIHLQIAGTEPSNKQWAFCAPNLAKDKAELAKELTPLVRKATTDGATTGYDMFDAAMETCATVDSMITSDLVPVRNLAAEAIAAIEVAKTAAAKTAELEKQVGELETAANNAAIEHTEGSEQHKAAVAAHDKAVKALEAAVKAQKTAEVKAGQAKEAAHVEAVKLYPQD